MSWSKRDISSLPEKVREKIPEEELKLNVGGQIRYERKKYEKVQWIGTSLKNGDEIKIKILDTSHIDEPKVRKQNDPDFDEKQKRKYYEELKNKYDTGKR